MIEVKDIVLIVFGTFLTAGLAVIGWLLVDMKAGIKERLKENADAIKETQKDLASFKAGLPYTYVLRDDFLRAISSLDKKIDNVAGDISKIALNITKLISDGEKT